MGSIPGEGKGNPFQYSCLENFMDREAWQATVHRVTGLTQRNTHAYTHTSGFLKILRADLVESLRYTISLLRILRVWSASVTRSPR